MDSYRKSHDILIQRLCGRERITFTDLFWLELLHVDSGALARDPGGLLNFLEPYLRQLALNCRLSGNFALLVDHTTEYVQRAAVTKPTPADVQHACNACALLRCISAFLLSVTPPQDAGALFAPPEASQHSGDILGRLIRCCLAALGYAPDTEQRYALLITVEGLCITLCSSQLYYADADTPGAHHAVAH
jgi:Dyggve-Melchior-Clausen syndrome protein